MGSSLSPIIADYEMTYVLREVFKKLNLKPKLCVKYVEDLLIIISEIMKNLLVFELNAFEDGLIFTYEHDIEGKIPFLDTIVIIEE